MRKDVVFGGIVLIFSYRPGTSDLEAAVGSLKLLTSSLASPICVKLARCEAVPVAGDQALRSPYVRVREADQRSTWMIWPPQAVDVASFVESRSCAMAAPLGGGT